MTLDIIKEILSIFSSTASIVVLTVGAAGLIYGFKLICGKFGIVINDTAMVEIIGIVSQVIKYLDQKFVDTIKKNSLDGSLTEYQKEIIKDKSINMIKSILNSEQVNFLLEKYNMSDIDDVLDILIESTIKDTRSDNTETIIVNDSTDYNNTSDNISTITYNPTPEEMESLNACPGNCESCTLSDECLICRC